MPRYAANTAVSADRSQVQIMQMLRRFGCEGFGCAEHAGRGVIQFVYQGVPVQFSVPLPGRADEEFVFTPTGRERSAKQREAIWEKETRRRWRAAYLVVKALLVGVEDGVLAFEEAFLPYVVWHDGRTTAEILVDPLRRAVAAGRMPALLPGSGSSIYPQLNEGDSP